MEWLIKLLYGDRFHSNESIFAERYWIIGSSFGFFSVIYLLCLIVSQFSTTHRNLSYREKVFWHLSIVRAVFGAFGLYAGMYSALFEHALTEDVVYGKTVISSFAVFVTVGFFFFECTMLFGSNIYFGYIDWNLALHHLLALVGYAMAVVYDANHFFGAVGLLLEMTTPFSAICWLLIKAKMANTTVWKVNQMILVHLFHCRTTVELYLWWVTYKDLTNVLANMPIFIGVLTYAELALVNFYLTPFWTYKKTWQFFNPVDWNHPESNKKTK